MNAPHSPSSDPDELASALVDGLLSVEEADRARQDPAVNHRVEEILRVRGQLRDIPPAPPGHAEHAIAAAVASFDPSVRPLRPPAPQLPPSTRPAAQRATGWLAAAAAILLVMLVAAVGLTSSNDSDDDSGDTASGAPESVEDSGGEAGTDEGAAPQTSGDDFTEDRDSNADSADEPLAFDELVDLGALDNPEDLEQQVADARVGLFPDSGEGGAATSTLPESAESCLGTSLAGDAARGAVLLVGRATYRGEDVIVHLYESATGAQQLVATNFTCVDVVDVPYEG